MRFRDLIVLIAIAVPAVAATELPALGVSSGDVTVSGISSGGFMAVQYHVAHSGQVAGAGILAGGPYECAEDGFWFFYPVHCMQPDSSHPIPDLATTVRHVKENAAAGLIDPPEGLNNDRVWLFSGGKDNVVTKSVVDALQAFYAVWTGNIEYRKVADAGHAMISADDAAAHACDASEAPFINRCQDADGEAVDAAGLLLQQLLSGEELQPKASGDSGKLLRFDQSEFSRAANAFGLGDDGYVFIPTGCRDGGCRLHIAFHGCKQSADDIGSKFAKDAGYNRWAQSNRIVVLYPQAAPRAPLAFADHFPYVDIIINPFGCWDWWGYEGDNYATKEGKQIKAVNLMALRLAVQLRESDNGNR